MNSRWPSMTPAPLPTRDEAMTADLLICDSRWLDAARKVLGEYKLFQRQFNGERKMTDVMVDDLRPINRRLDDINRREMQLQAGFQGPSRG